MEERIAAGLAAMGVPLPSPAAPAMLAEYARLLLETNQVMNLTAITDPDKVADLHFLDSAALLTLEGVDFKGKRVIDVGTGAGFPGLPLKILEPSISLTLLDSLGKRVNWLSEVCADLGLTDVEEVAGTLHLEGVRTVHARAEEQALVKGFRDSFDFAVSRAVADLRVLTELCLPYVKPGGLFLSMKAVDCAEELSGAAHAVSLLGGKVEALRDYEIPGAGVTHRVVLIRKTAPTPKGYPRRWAKLQKAPL